jgi:hypothetical protein
MTWTAVSKNRFSPWGSQGSISLNRSEMTAAGVLEAEGGFHRVAGYRRIPKLGAASHAHDVVALPRANQVIDKAWKAA